MAGNDWAWLPTPRVEILPRALEALQRRFVYCEEIADLISAAFYEPCNLLLWGPGGHGKSDMVLAAIKSLGLRDSEVFVQLNRRLTSDPRMTFGVDLGTMNEIARLNDSGAMALAGDYLLISFDDGTRAYDMMTVPEPSTFVFCCLLIGMAFVLRHRIAGAEPVA